MLISELEDKDKNLDEIMQQLGKDAKKSSQILAKADTNIKNNAIKKSSEIIRNSIKEIIEANKKDISLAKSINLSENLIDRIALDTKRIESIALSLKNISDLPDPVGELIDSSLRPNKLVVERIRIPLGVIGIIYESRPNVTSDAGGLCIKSGNTAILRCGTESYNSSLVLMNCLQKGLAHSNLPKECVQLVPTMNREAVGKMLKMHEYINILVPRGGKSLVKRVQSESTIPVLSHLEGNCHTYIHSESNVEMSVKIVENAKLRRTSICGATESLLIDKNILNSHLPHIIENLIQGGCEIVGDRISQNIDSRIQDASNEDWSKEYLDYKISIKVVEDINEAIKHISLFGSNHTDCIVTDDKNAAEKFLNAVDSSIVMHNTSTQFADGFEFGLGAEIGISTNRLHARGPVGLKELTTYKWLVHGNGQIRT